MSLNFNRASGHCDKCGNEIKFDGKNCPCLYKFAIGANPKRYIKVCYKCFQLMSDNVTFAFGE